GAAVIGCDKAISAISVEEFDPPTRHAHLITVSAPTRRCRIDGSGLATSGRGPDHDQDDPSRGRDAHIGRPKNDRCLGRLSKAHGQAAREPIVPEKVEAGAALANCRALINQINARLSAEKPLVNVSSAKELLFYLEFAASCFH